MRRYLAVANQTLQRAELAEELRKRFEAGPSSFYLLVPDTRAADYPDVAAAAGVLQPGMTWWMTEYRAPPPMRRRARRPGNGSARCWLTRGALGVPVEGDLGSAQPVEAMEKVFTDHRFDEIIVATLPRPLSQWPRPTCPMGRAPVRAAGHDHHHQALAGRPDLGVLCVHEPGGRDRWLHGGA